MARTSVLSLNCCLLPTHLRWIFRAHRGAESLSAATARVAAAIIDADHAAALDVVHLQEVFSPASLRQLAAVLRPAGFLYATEPTSCGLATLSKRPLDMLELRETAFGPFTPKGWAALLVRAAYPGGAAEVHVNCHFASELDGSHAVRLRQAGEVGAWVRAALAPACSMLQAGDSTLLTHHGQLSTPILAAGVDCVLVVGDLNEPEGVGAERLAAALGASPLAQGEGGSCNAEPEKTYRWLGGLVHARLDRGFLFRRLDDTKCATPPLGGTASAKPKDDKQVLGTELAGVVLHGLGDVSDHLPLWFTYYAA